MFAQEQLKTLNVAELKQLLLLDRIGNHPPPIEEDEHGKVIDSGWKPLTAQDIVDRGGIYPEQMARVLEEVIREYLPLAEQFKGISFEPHQTAEQRERDYKLSEALGDVCFAIFSLADFHTVDSPVLLKECILSQNRNIRKNAIFSYAMIAGAEAIPYFRELIKDGHFSGRWVYFVFYLRLEEIALKFNNTNKAADFEKFITFLKELEDSEYPLPTVNVTPQDNTEKTNDNPLNTPLPESPPSIFVDATEQPAQDTPPPKLEKTSANKNIFGFIFVVLLAIIGGMVVWSKKS